MLVKGAEMAADISPKSLCQQLLRASQYFSIILPPGAHLVKQINLFTTWISNYIHSFILEIITQIKPLALTAV